MRMRRRCIRTPLAVRRALTQQRIKQCTRQCATRRNVPEARRSTPRISRIHA